MKSATSLTPSILNTTYIGVIDPEESEKCNTKMKSMRLFTAATQHLTLTVVNMIILAIVEPRGQLNQNKDMKIADSVLFS